MTRTKYILIIVALSLLFLLPRIPKLGYDFTNTDAFRWHIRSENFLNAIRYKKLADTYQRYHPGVTMMWLNAAVILVTYKYQLTYTNTPKSLQNADYFPILDGISKGAIVAVLLVMLIFQLILLSKIFNKKTALLYVFLICVEPYMIGINRWFHLTSLEVFFGFTSLLFLLYWHKYDKKMFMFVSAVFLGLAILTKTTTLMLVPILLVIFVSRFFKSHKREGIQYAALYFLTTVAVIFLLFPALWVDPIGVYKQLYDAIFLAVTDNVRSEMLPVYMQPFYYLIILGFKLSPFTLILAIVSVVSLRKTKDFYLQVMALSFLWFYFCFSVTEKKIDRYVLAMFPYLLIICAYYLSGLQKRLQLVYVLMSLVFLGYVTYVYFPHYFAYYSPVFGGTRVANNIGVYENGGAYFAEAAFYLNTKGRDKSTYVPNSFESFSSYYKGHSQREFDTNTDYVVNSLDIDRKSFDGVYCNKIDKTFGSKDLQVVAVFSCK